MAMGTRRQRQRQEELWYRRDIAEASRHPFYRRLNGVLDEAGFDDFCEIDQAFVHVEEGHVASGTSIEPHRCQFQFAHCASLIMFR